MKIDRSVAGSAGDEGRLQQAGRNRASGSADVARAGSGAATPRSDQRDAIELSPQAQNVVRLSQDRLDRAQYVDQLRQQVDAGTYRPDADAVARRIAEHLK